MEIRKAEYQKLKSWIDRQLQMDTMGKRPQLADRTKTRVGFAVYDGAGQIAGAINGEIFWNHLHISLLSVDPQYRGQGLGSQLIERIEQEAVSQRCRMMVVETMSWQAPEFYMKHGFDVIGKIDDFPIAGEYQVILRKTLMSSLYR